MPDRSYNAPTAEDHRFSFNGKEDDKLIGWQDYGFRWCDKKIRRFVSVDPLFKKYPELTTYQFASNSPVIGVDLDGKELFVTTKGEVVGNAIGRFEDQVIIIDHNSYHNSRQALMESHNQQDGLLGIYLKTKEWYTNSTVVPKDYFYSVRSTSGTNYSQESMVNDIKVYSRVKAMLNSIVFGESELLLNVNQHVEQETATSCNAAAHKMAAASGTVINHNQRYAIKSSSPYTVVDEKNENRPNIGYWRGVELIMNSLIGGDVVF